MIGGIEDLYALATGGRRACRAGRGTPVAADAADDAAEACAPAGHCGDAGAPRETDRNRGPILQAKGLTKRYGGLLANSDIDFTVNHGELRGIIGPNGAGKSTFFKMLTCEVPPTSGQIVFEGRDITGMTVTDVCQLGLTKSYQINQLFNRLTVRENLTIAALAELRGKFRLDLFRIAGRYAGSRRSGRAYARTGRPHRARADTPVSALGLWRKAPARSRPGARDLAEPAAARRAARRHEPARAGRDGAAAQIDQPAAAL